MNRNTESNKYPTKMISGNRIGRKKSTAGVLGSTHLNAVFSEQGRGFAANDEFAFLLVWLSLALPVVFILWLGLMADCVYVNHDLTSAQYGTSCSCCTCAL